MAYNAKTRNIIGFIGWFIAGFIVSLLALVPMVVREKHQAERGDFDLEWNDIIGYTLAIVLGASAQGLLLQYLGVIA